MKITNLLDTMYTLLGSESPQRTGENNVPCYAHSELIVATCEFWGPWIIRDNQVFTPASTTLNFDG